MPCLLGWCVSGSRCRWVHDARLHGCSPGTAPNCMPWASCVPILPPCTSLFHKAWQLLNALVLLYVLTSEGPPRPKTRPRAPMHNAHLHRNVVCGLLQRRQHLNAGHGWAGNDKISASALPPGLALGVVVVRTKARTRDRVLLQSKCQVRFDSRETNGVNALPPPS